MARDYKNFPVADFRHDIISGKNNYTNKFFHDIDLGWILNWIDQENDDKEDVQALLHRAQGCGRSEGSV